MEELEKKYYNLQEQLKSQQDMFIQTQEYLADLKKQLEIKVEDRTRELAESNKEIIELLYRASHDFKSPVASLKGLLNILDANIKDQFSREIITKAFDTLKLQETFFYNLNLYHALKTEKIVVREVILDALLKKVISELEPNFPDIKKSLYLKSDPSVCINTSFFHVQIVLKVLIENAYIFSDGNQVMVNAEFENEFIKIIVSDSGEGITSVISEKIFDMFFRGSPKSKGNGLGLFIAKSAAERIGAELKFESREGAGTDFALLIRL